MRDRFLSLPVKEQLSPSLSLSRNAERYTLVLDYPKAQAATRRQGAQWLLGQPTGRAEEREGGKGGED